MSAGGVGFSGSSSLVALSSVEGASAATGVLAEIGYSVGLQTVQRIIVVYGTQAAAASGVAGFFVGVSTPPDPSYSLPENPLFIPYYIGTQVGSATSLAPQAVDDLVNWIRSQKKE
jgi:hypothetical protein